MDNATRRAATEWAMIRAISANLEETPLTPYLLALVSEDMARQEQPVLHMQATFPAATTEVKPVYGPDSDYAPIERASDGLLDTIETAAFYRYEPDNAVVADYRKPEEPEYNRFLIRSTEAEDADDNLLIEVVGDMDTDEALAQLAEIEAGAAALLDSMQKRESAQNWQKAPVSPVTPEPPLPPLLDCPPPDEWPVRVAELEPCAVDPSGEEQARSYVLRQIKDKQGIDPQFIRDLTGWKGGGIVNTFIQQVQEQVRQAERVYPKAKADVLKIIDTWPEQGIAITDAETIRDRYEIEWHDLLGIIAACEEEKGTHGSRKLANRLANRDRMKAMRARQKTAATA